MKHAAYWTLELVVLLALVPLQGQAQTECHCPRWQMMERRMCNDGHGCFGEVGLFHCNQIQRTGCTQCIDNVDQVQCCNLNFAIAREGNLCGNPNRPTARVKALVEEWGEERVYVPVCGGGFEPASHSGGSAH